MGVELKGREEKPKSPKIKMTCGKKKYTYNLIVVDFSLNFMSFQLIFIYVENLSYFLQC